MGPRAVREALMPRRSINGARRLQWAISRERQARMLLRLKATPGQHVPMPVLIAQVLDDDYRPRSAADYFVVHRTARRLRDLGFDVEGHSRKGYRIIEKPPTEGSGTGI